MARKPTPTPLDASDSQSLHEAIQTLIDRFGRGGLSHYAERIGVTPSMLQKRLKTPGKAFDAPTIRASLLVLEAIRSEDQPPEQAEHNPAPEAATPSE